MSDPIQNGFPTVTQEIPIVPARLLIIEDDPTIPLLIKDWLSRHSSANLVIDHAETVELGIARAPGAAAILLDLNIDDKWRKEQTVTIIPKLREVAPVIVLTGYSEGDRESDEAFASDILTQWGADFVTFKSDVLNNSKEGLAWLFLIIQASIARRIYRNRVENRK